jgi:hypothetical protein
MAIVKSFNGRSIRKPGAYSKFSVDNSAGSDLAANDVLFLVGESANGAPGSSDGIQSFDAANLSALIAKYGTGPLVDCAVASVRPSKSPGVGGAGKILVFKTNASVQASATLLQSSNPYASVSGSAWGKSDNFYSVVVSAGDSASQKNISVTQLGGTVESLGENLAQNVISVQYTGNGSAATLTISGLTRAALTLTTALTGQSDGSLNLSVPLANKTIKQLVDYVNAQPGYVASVVTASLSSGPANQLDPVSAVNILVLKNLLQLQHEIITLINTSARVQAVEPSQPLGSVPDNQTKALSGGAQGASANSDFSTAFANSLGEDYNVLLPCVSRDASEDIADAVLGFTDPSSSYTIAAVIAAASSHLTLRGNVQNRKEAQGMGGIRKSTKAAAYAAINNVADYNFQVAMQDVVFTDAVGDIEVGHPHVFAAMCAGIRLGTDVGTPLTHKFLNVLQVGHFLNPATLLPTGDFNPGVDYNDAITNGVLFSEKFGNGNRIVVDNTTYGIDGSFVFNRGSVIEASYFVFKTLRDTADSVFVGNKTSKGLAKSIKSAIRNKCRELAVPEVNIITPSDANPDGIVEKTFVVTVVGNTASVQLEFQPVQGLDFILLSFTLGDIQQTA